jgi:hypothetical protein
VIDVDAAGHDFLRGCCIARRGLPPLKIGSSAACAAREAGSALPRHSAPPRMRPTAIECCIPSFRAFRQSNVLLFWVHQCRQIYVTALANNERNPHVMRRGSLGGAFRTGGFGGGKTPGFDSGFVTALYVVLTAGPCGILAIANAASFRILMRLTL